MVDLNDLTLEELRNVAKNTKGFNCKKDSTEDELRETLTAFIEKVNEQKKPIDKPSEGNEVKENAVKIQSDYKGEIQVGISIVDFGEDGKAEVTQAQAKILQTLKGYKKC